MKYVKKFLLAFAVLGMAVCAQATNAWDTLTESAGTSITAVTSSVMTLLGAMLGIWVAYLVYRLIRRTWGR